jgi:hypothetical protein
MLSEEASDRTKEGRETSNDGRETFFGNDGRLNDDSEKVFFL